MVWKTGILLPTVGRASLSAGLSTEVFRCARLWRAIRPGASPPWARYGLTPCFALRASAITQWGKGVKVYEQIAVQFVSGTNSS